MPLCNALVKDTICIIYAKVVPNIVRPCMDLLVKSE